MGIYIGREQVMTRLAGKVRFTDDPETYPDKMPYGLLDALIMEAEGEVERDLSPRYAAPFQTDDGQSFTVLPERPTKLTIRTMCELKAVIRVLDTDFGSGSATDASKYYEKLEKLYDKMKDRELELKDNSFNIWKNPPLPCLRLGYHNEDADTGFRGRVMTLNGGETDADYAADQVNKPAQTYWNGGFPDSNQTPER